MDKPSTEDISIKPIVESPFIGELKSAGILLILTAIVQAKDSFFQFSRALAADIPSLKEISLLSGNIILIFITYNKTVLIHFKRAPQLADALEVLI
jgi:hypothetical protein